MNKYILTIDLGTTSLKMIVWDHTGKKVFHESDPVKLAYPAAGWVECDPEGIVQRVQDDLLRIDYPLEGIGLTNQRETTILWNKQGKPLYPAIVWQDRRTASWCQIHKGDQEFLYERTGLVLDPYFSLSKVIWLINHIPRTEDRPYFGTFDTFLIWKLTGGQSFVTDYTNASRTMMYNIYSLLWDREIIDRFSLQAVHLPRVMPSFHTYGEVKTKHGMVPILGVIGDQQSSFLGQGCFHPGDIKNTYGTGCFLLVNCSDTVPRKPGGLIVTLASLESDRPIFALEASAFSAGATMEWLRQAGLIARFEETDGLARQAGPMDELVIIPAFCGLGTPHWDPYARGAVLGLTPGVGRAEIVRASLESVALESAALIEHMSNYLTGITEISADGGMSLNSFLMQFQADVSGKKIRLFPEPEATSLGVFFLLASRLGYLDRTFLQEKKCSGTMYIPNMTESQRKHHLVKWQRGIERVKGWSLFDENT